MPRKVVTIGNFDGVHLGHATLIERARLHAGPGGRVVALAFDPHPMAVLRPGQEPDRLTTFEQRTGLLRTAGADEVMRLEPDRQLLSMSPATFLRYVQDSFDPAWLVEGADFHFGKGRSGHVAELRTIGARLGFGVEVVDPVEVALADQSVVRASSSIVRWLLSHGRVADAAAVLGRPYALTGPVVGGDRRGRTIGFPTANLEPEQIPPGPGVYACWADLPGGRALPAAVHVGERPSVGDGEHRVEAHVLGLPTSSGSPGLVQDWTPINGLDETGWRLGLRFILRIRDPIAFASNERLAEQLARDCARVADRLNNVAATPEEARA